MEGGVDLAFGLATSVGPVPLDSVEPAVRFALAAHPRFPTAPVLSGTASSLLAQAVHGLEGVALLPPGLLRVDADRLPSPAEAAGAGASLDGPEFLALHAFCDAIATVDDGSPHGGPVRVGLLGPITVALALRAAGVPIDKASALAGGLVEQRAAAVLHAARRAVPDAVVAVVLSEPGLVGAMHPTFPLSPWEIRALLDPVVDVLDTSPSATGGLVIGVHVPGRTDWETVIGSGGSMISAPADGGLVGWAPQLADLLEQGGWIAWGAVPVDQPLGTSEELLWRRLAAVWGDMGAVGVDPMLLRLRSMVSPADGLGHFGLSQAERVIDLVASVSSRVRRQTIAARLSLGA
jgi:hypothetical protein